MRLSGSARAKSSFVTVSHRVGRAVAGERDTHACEMLTIMEMITGSIVSYHPFEVIFFCSLRLDVRFAHTMLASAPSDLVSTRVVNDGEPSRTTTHYPSSVVFLLSDNYEKVFSKFNFPEPTTPSRSTANWRDAYNGSAETPFRGLDEDFVNSVLEFDFFSLPSCGPSTRCASVEPQGAKLAEDYANLQFAAAETERLLRRVMSAPSLLVLEDHKRAEVQQQLQNLCRPARVSRFVAHYFDIWHRNCRIVHRPSFSLDTCREPLVLAVIFLGAMYSSDPAERIAVAAVIEHVESFIFSCLSSSFPEVKHDGGTTSVASDDEQKFQNVQAAFLMVITLFWTGTEAQKRRAATKLFDIVVEVSTFSLVS
jgi:hypothetical protein